MRLISMRNVGLLGLFGLALALAFQNCGKADSASTSLKSKKRCTGIICNDPEPTPSESDPSPQPSQNPGVSPSPTPSLGASSPRLVTYGVRKGSTELRNGDYYFHNDRLTIFATANNATTIKYGNDNMTCTGTGSISCTIELPDPMDINPVGFYGHASFKALNSARPGEEDIRWVASQCFSLLQGCKYLAYPTSAELARPRVIGISLIERTPENCGKKFEEDPQLVRSTWDRSQANECLLFRAGFDRTQESDFECFYAVKNSNDEAMNAPLLVADKQPCDGGKTLTQMGLDPNQYTGTVDGWGAMVVLRKSTRQADRVVYKTHCDDQNCTTTIDQNTHRKQSCTLTGSVWSCTNL